MQLIHQVRHALRLGLLREGDQLPTVKEVVARLAINPNTVLKAHREAEIPRPGGGPAGGRDVRDWNPSQSAVVAIRSGQRTRRDVPRRQVLDSTFSDLENCFLNKKGDRPMETPTFTAATFYRDPKAALAWLERAFGFEVTMAIEGRRRRRRCATTR